jgi:hypothetical protein
MRNRVAIVVVLLLACSRALPAQTPRPTLTPGNTVLIAQYQCAADQLARADALITEITTPTLNKYVAAGKIISWGYFGAYVGGRNNRTTYLWAADPVALLQARKDYLPELMANAKYPEFVKICGAAEITLHNLITVSGGSPASGSTK